MADSVEQPSASANRRIAAELFANTSTAIKALADDERYLAARRHGEAIARLSTRIEALKLNRFVTERFPVTHPALGGFQRAMEELATRPGITLPHTLANAAGDLHGKNTEEAGKGLTGSQFHPRLAPGAAAPKDPGNGARDTLSPAAITGT